MNVISLFLFLFIVSRGNIRTFLINRAVQRINHATHPALAGTEPGGQDGVPQVRLCSQEYPKLELELSKKLKLSFFYILS